MRLYIFAHSNSSSLASFSSIDNILLSLTLSISEGRSLLANSFFTESIPLRSFLFLFVCLVFVGFGGRVRAGVVGVTSTVSVRSWGLPFFFDVCSELQIYTQRCVTACYTPEKVARFNFFSHEGLVFIRRARFHTKDIFLVHPTNAWVRYRKRSRYHVLSFHCFVNTFTKPSIF